MPHRKRPKFVEPLGFCDTGKAQFKTESGALKARKRMKSSDHVEDVSTLNAYLCPRCHRWHLGNRGE